MLFPSIIGDRLEATARESGSPDCWGGRNHVCNRLGTMPSRSLCRHAHGAVKANSLGRTVPVVDQTESLVMSELRTFQMPVIQHLPS
jgi:hypothetical protein